MTAPRHPDETAGRPPAIVAVFRALGWIAGVAAALLAVTAAAMLGAGGAPYGTVPALLLLALAVLLGFGAAFLFGFAANLALLHDIRAELRQQRRAGGAQSGT
jgi:hypothetical protein